MPHTPAQVPAKLVTMPIKTFGAHMRPSRLKRRRLANLYYQDEYYYWSGVPPLKLGHQPSKPPLNCLVQPSSKCLIFFCFVQTYLLKRQGTAEAGAQPDKAAALLPR